MPFKNQLWALVVSMVAYSVIWYLVVLFTGYTYLAYLIADISGAFLYSFIYIPNQEKLHFYSSNMFNYLFSTSLIYFFGLSIFFKLIGLI
ncbi:MAG: hypothetical protein LKJ88_00280 [Bacilli bacterium]|jgi:hypothetical protein|nr:hypothetical protein [Bacilli bacterium]